MGRMDVNPYQSPREVGYDLPVVAAEASWIRDKLNLLVVAHLWSLPLFALPFWFWLWLTQ
jgi:hypothetical protein